MSHIYQYESYTKIHKTLDEYYEIAEDFSEEGYFEFLSEDVSQFNDDWKDAAGSATKLAALGVAGVVAGTAGAYFLAKRAVMKRKIKNLTKEKTNLENDMIDLGGKDNKDRRAKVKNRIALIDDRMTALVSAHGSKINGLGDYRELQLTKMRLKLNAKRMKEAQRAKDIQRVKRLRNKQNDYVQQSKSLKNAYKSKFDKQEARIKKK